ncbi:MAG: 50S ribosomal protein L5 [Candidatus Micrarchaeota archaeon]
MSKSPVSSHQFPETGNPKQETENPMRQITIEKVTANIGIGASGDRLDNAKELLSKLTGAKVVLTKAKKRNPTFKLRPGLEIGVKTTLRGARAFEFLEKSLAARKKTLHAGNFDHRGNFSFGVHEYIDFPGAKYDPKIGMMGFDVCVTLRRRGKRVGERRLKRSKVGRHHLVSKEEGIGFARAALGVKVE